LKYWTILTSSETILIVKLIGGVREEKNSKENLVFKLNNPSGISISKNWE
jgi:hypothetical protein